MDNQELSFVTNPGVILDRILTVLAHQGRDVAMDALSKAVRQDVQENGRARGYAPRTLLWYVVGARVSGDPSFHVQPAFVNALSLTEHEAALYRVQISAIEAFRAQAGESIKAPRVPTPGKRYQSYYDGLWRVRNSEDPEETRFEPLVDEFLRNYVRTHFKGWPGHALRSRLDDVLELPPDWQLLIIQGELPDDIHKVQGKMILAISVEPTTFGETRWYG
ncbi:hypothetical protein C5615_29840 [Burkholderia cepacia]|uniref:Uncharacterized protein n=1 Tax=Burkholderia cepacia TaxID=292 RepID=A0A2S8IEA7_BURCE|nr:hypothetical protein [Burkholderia cepacia]PQP13116.1 hypothetical protein C5615_29840 [Burkholderia cepacia]HDR9510431.1 hypothetical protein [Burkholderia cepacia]